MKRFLGPAAVLVAALFAWVWVGLSDPAADHIALPILGLSGLVGYFIGTDWMLLTIANAPPPTSWDQKIARLLGAVLLAAPTTALLLGFVAVAEDRTGWPIISIPAVLVLPFALFSIVKVARTGVAAPSAAEAEAAR